MSTTPLPIGSMIGILGGGQLARMTALAAAQLGYRTHIYDPAPGACAALVSAAHTQKNYDDTSALEHFAKACDVITLEFENIPLPAVQTVEKFCRVAPSSKALEIAQDRLLEKTTCQTLGIATAPFMAVDLASELAKALTTLGTPAILKTRRMGYDGKGQIKISSSDEIITAQSLLDLPCILEGLVDFTHEVSVIVARTKAGETKSFPVVHNIHENHILKTTHAPASIPAVVAKQAQSIAETLANHLQVEGLLAVEMFVLKDGTLLINEMAPRPHNSGHWSMDGCVTSQFEQLVRAITGHPLGSADIIAPTTMHNLLGDDILTVHHWLKQPNSHVHVYDKGDIRKDRKLGHVNVVG